MRPTTLSAVLCLAMASPAVQADDNLPPFDFSNEFYLANGINPATLVGRPDGTPPGSIIDNRENGPEFNNVRILQANAAYDHSGHPIFFSVTGLPSLASFTNNSAGQRAREIADEYKVYEFPRASNPPFAVFPKRQDLIADLRNGYFSNDPLGIWQINLVRFTPAALNTPAGQAALNQIAARNGTDLDGTPLIRTISEIESLLSQGFVTISVPAADGSQGFRWFFCPIIEDPRDGAIAPDAFLEVTENSGAAEFIALFNCLQQTGEPCSSGPCTADFDNNGSLNINDFVAFQSAFAARLQRADMNRDNQFNVNDFVFFQSAFAAGCR